MNNESKKLLAFYLQTTSEKIRRYIGADGGARIFVEAATKITK